MNRYILIRFIRMQQRFADMLQELNEELAVSKEELKTESLETQVDVMWFLQHTTESVIGIRSALQAFEKVLAMITCLQWQQKTLLENEPEASPEEAEASPIRGLFAMGTPDSKVVPGIPLFSRSPEKYYAACEFFGLPIEEDAVKKGVVTFDWKRLTELLTEYVANGGTLPKEVFTKVYNEYRVLTRGVAAIGTLECQTMIDNFVKPDKSTQVKFLEDAYPSNPKSKRVKGGAT